MSDTAPVEMRFVATEEKGEVSALLRRPEEARALLVLGHGASTNMRHAFLEGLSAALAAEGVATFRYQFPYMERGGGLDARPVLRATVRSAVTAAAGAAPDLPLFAGGHSLSGRMTSQAMAEATPASLMPSVRGLVFVAFPLHPAGKPGTERADHLAEVTVPMLFLSGTRDDLADLALLRPIVERLGERATLHIVETADHGFKVLKRSRSSDEPVLDELARVTAEWMTMLLAK